MKDPKHVFNHLLGDLNMDIQRLQQFLTYDFDQMLEDARKHGEQTILKQLLERVEDGQLRESFLRAVITKEATEVSNE